MKLSAFFQQNPKIALTFSGGVDSAFLLYAAKEYGAETTAYYMSMGKLSLRLRQPMIGRLEWFPLRIL